MTGAATDTSFNMAAHVLRHAGRAPDATALDVLGGEGERWSYGALAAAVGATAAGLSRMGLGPGARVLIRLGNSVDFPIVYLGALVADMVPVPTSAQLTVREITALAGVVRPDLVVLGPGVAAPDLPGVRVIGPEDLARFRALPPGAPLLGPADRAGYIVFTSGTTRLPRAVLHAHRAILARQFMMRDWAGMRRDDRVMHAGAFNWTYTLGTGLMDPWSVGATALIAREGTPVAALPDLLARHGATIFAAAPGVFRQMMKAPLPSLPRLRHALSAGEKLPEALRVRWREQTGTDIHEAYGQSECSTFVSGSPDRPAPPGTLGRAQRGRRIAVLNEDGRPVVGAPGMLAVAGDDPGLMLGYLDPETGAPDRLAAPWFATGDLARIEADGVVSFLGRADDLINAGGYRVAPQEIEAVAAEFPGIEECAAFERDLRDDVRVIALAYVSAMPLDEAALARHCAAGLARYKCPRILARLDALPRGPNGKLLRSALRDRDWEAIS